jgi:hypothetical protein
MGLKHGRTLNLEIRAYILMLQTPGTIYTGHIISNGRNGNSFGQLSILQVRAVPAHRERSWAKEIRVSSARRQYVPC